MPAGPSASGNCTVSGGIWHPVLTSSNLISVMNARISASVSLLLTRYLCLDRMSSILSKVSKTSLQPRCTALLLCSTCIKGLLMPGDKAPHIAGEGGNNSQAVQCNSMSLRLPCRQRAATSALQACRSASCAVQAGRCRQQPALSSKVPRLPEWCRPVCSARADCYGIAG